MFFNLEDRGGCDSFPRRGLTGSVCCAVVVMCMRGTVPHRSPNFESMLCSGRGSS